jgi:hypothetical protein
MFGISGNLSDLCKTLSGLVSVGGLALKNQLKLRAVLLVGLAFSALSHVVGPKPSLTDLFWNAVSFAINSFVLTQLILDRTHIGLSAEQEKLFSAFRILSPGEFRDLVKLAQWKTAQEGEMLTRQGVKPDQLFYVLEGEVHVAKGKRKFTVEPKVFIGEVAYLHGWPATATVTLSEGARYLIWDVVTLQRGLDSRVALRGAMLRLLGLDTAQKVADTIPAKHA